MSATLPNLNVQVHALNCTPNFQFDRERIQHALSKLQLIVVAVAFAINLGGMLDRTASSSLQTKFEPPTNGAPEDRDDAVSQWANG